MTSAARPRPVAAVVLAAGGSTRMGSAKPLLPLRGSTYLEAILATLREVSPQRPLQPLLAVLGDRAGEVLERVHLGSAVALLNRGWREGMLSSLQVSIRHLQIAGGKGPSALLVALVDSPLFSATTVEALLRAFAQSDAPIVVPEYRGQHGHPVLFHRRVWDELLAAPQDAGARAVVEAHRQEVLAVAVDDPWVVRDADCPADHAQMAHDAEASKST